VDFQDTDVRVVIGALADAASLNVIYGELPPRKITLRMRQPVPRESIPALLRSIAQSNGLRLTAEGTMLRVEAAGADVRAAAIEQDTAEVRLFVYRLKHARAPKLSSTLQSLFGGTAVGAARAVGQTRTLSQQLRDQQVPPLDPNQPSGVAPPITSVEATAIPGRLRGEVQIVPEETTNSVLVRAQPADYEVIRQAIEALDLRPLQVVIEVLIAEVRRSSDWQLSVSGKAEGSPSGRPNITGSGELRGNTDGDVVLQLLRAGSVDVTAAISALSARGDVRVLSRPVLFAQNNLEARILVGSQRPFVQVFRSLPTDAAVRDQVVQYRDVGTSLTITPTINPDGYVNLQVTQEVSTATSETQFGAPVISTREAATHLFVHDGQTGVLGGLVDHQQDRSRSGIPILSQIPVLGALFGTTRSSTTDGELFLFLTPHIVESDQDADRVREQIERRGEQLERALDRSARVVPPDSVRNQP